MRFISANTRLSAGLIAIIGFLLTLAITLGMVPDRARMVREHRAELCEALAVNFSLLAENRETQVIRQTLQAIVERMPELHSAGMRTTDDRLIVDVGDHAEAWKSSKIPDTPDTHVRVPVFSGKRKFADVEMLFSPIEPPGMWAFLLHPWVLLMTFMGSSGFLASTAYLGFMLRQLNPSKAVPGHVRRALNNLAEGLLVLDTRGRIVLINSAFERLSEREESGLLGRRPKILPWLDERNQPLTQFPWDTAAQTGQPVFNTMMHLVDPDRQRRVLNVNCAPVPSMKGKSNGVMVSFEDVTSLDEARIEIQKSRDLAEAANRAKSDFLANMSHEIRTPMNAILGFTEMLRRGMAESKHDEVEYLSTIHTSGSHLLELINDILDLSKIEAGKMEMEVIECEPMRIIAEVVSILKLRAEEKGLWLRVDPAARIPSHVQCDPVRLRQVLTNLVGNAIKFTESGGVTIRPEFRDGVLAVDIDDTGIGISAVQVQRIFNPFSQADSSTTRRFGGTGLGLAISRKITQALGGDLSVQSTPGKGSTFTATFCVGATATSELISYDELVHQQRHGPSSKAMARTFAGQRVLVVDDGEANLKLMSLVLRKARLHVDQARNGEQAIECVRQNDYAMIFMDMQMPVMDGYTATARLRELGLSVPIVALTAHVLNGEEEKCLNAGCSHYLSKPIHIDRLLELVAQYLPSSDTPVDEDEKMVDDRVQAASRDDLYADSPTAPVSRDSFDHAPLSQTHNQMARSLNIPESLRSSLQLEPNEVKEIVQDFKVELDGRIEEMRTAVRENRWQDLAKSAHWLKGAGGTVGFHDFVSPSLQLEEVSKTEQDSSQAHQLLEQIVQLSQLIEE